MDAKQRHKLALGKKNQVSEADESDLTGMVKWVKLRIWIPAAPPPPSSAV